MKEEDPTNRELRNRETEANEQLEQLSDSYQLIRILIRFSW